MLPDGFRYEPEFLSQAEAGGILVFVRSLDFREVRMHGVAARRTTRHFGLTYEYESRRVAPTDPIPSPLVDLRDAAAAFVGYDRDRFVECLVTRYPPGSGIGWHRDAPMFGSVVVGLSLGGTARMRFRRGKVGAWETAEVVLQPGSLYVLSGSARWSWQHSIPASRATNGGSERYSVTYRTLRTSDPAHVDPGQTVDVKGG